MTTGTRPKLTPDLEAVFKTILHIDKEKEAPQAPINAGRYQPNVQALLEALQEGFDAYLKERTHFFKEDENARVLFAAYDAAGQEDDARFTRGKNGKRIIKLYSIDDLYALPDPEYLITRILESVATSLLYGMSGTGKTFTALNIALCVTHGIYWMGRRVKQGPVWYVNTEGKYSLKRRLQAWYKEHNNLSPTPIFRVIPWSLDLRENFQDLLNTIEAMNELEKPVLIIFDNFSMCAPGIEQNKQEQVTPALSKLNSLAQEHECHVMALHHTNKEDDFNGSMAFRNHVDTMIQLKKEDKADKHSPILFCSQKTRDEEPFSDIKTELKQVILYTDPITLEPVTSCVVVASEAPTRQEGLKDTTQNVLDILGDDVLSYSDWKKEAMNALHISKPTFDRCKNELLEKQYIEKCKVNDVRYEQYRKLRKTTENQAEKGSESEGNDE